MTAIADQRGLVPNTLEVDLLPRAAHVTELLRVVEDCCQGLRDLIKLEEAQDKVPKTRSQLDFRLDERVTVSLEGHEENFLHFVGERAQASQRLLRDVREHLQSENLQNFIVDDSIRLCHKSSNSRRVYNFAMTSVEVRPEGPHVQFKLVKSVGSEAL